MPSPIDYLGMMPIINPMEKLTQGLQAGGAISEMQLRRQAIEQKAKEDQAALERMELYRTKLAETMQDPTPQRFGELTALFPEQREALKQSWDMLSTGQKQNTFKQGVQVYNALLSGKPETAKKLLQDTITAEENSGKDPQGLKTLISSIDQDPNSAAGAVGLYMSSVDPDGWKKVIDTYATQEKLPSEIRKVKAEAVEAEGKATIKAAEAAIAPQKVQADYQRVLEQIKDSQLGRELDKQRVQISAMTAAIGRTTNDLKRQELSLKVAEMQRDLVDKYNEKKSTVYAAYDSAQNIKDTVGRALSLFKTGAAQRAHGPVASRMPTVDVNTANYEELLNTIGSQAFLQMIPQMKGTGALSEAEGAKLQAAMSNLSLRQGPEQAKKNLLIIKNLTDKAFKNVERKYGIDIKQDKAKERKNISGAAAAAALGI